MSIYEKIVELKRMIHIGKLSLLSFLQAGVHQIIENGQMSLSKVVAVSGGR